MASVIGTNWIRPASWTEEYLEKTYLVLYRREVEAEQLPDSFKVRFSADSRYKLFCNGRLIQFGPMKGDDTCRYADTLELAPFLKAGRNVLAVEVLCVGSDPWNSNHSLFTAGVHGLYAEGLDERGWRCHICTTVTFPAEENDFAPLHIHETAAGEPACAGWKEPLFDASGWDEAVICPAGQIPSYMHGEKLRERSIPFTTKAMNGQTGRADGIFKSHSFKLPVTKIPAHSTERFVLDAGEEMTAFLRLALAGGKDARIELLESECYVTEEGKGDRTDSAAGHLEGYTDVYTVCGMPREVYEPFWFRTFRFIQVTVSTREEPLEISAIEYEETGYPLDVRTQVTTSDPTLAPVWEISLRTLRRCMHDTYMDCPFYEQLSYVMDTRSQILYTYAAAADDRLARQAIDDFARSQRPDGLLNASYPNKNANVIPGFSIYFILMLHDHMMYFGDRGMIRKYLPTVEKILQFFRAHRTEAGLLDKVGGVNGKAPFWSFIDWAAEWMPTWGMPTAGLGGPITMESLLYIYGLQTAAELAEYAGETEEAGQYRRDAENVQKAVRANCMSEDGMLTDGPGSREVSQHAQVFGILTDTLLPEEGRRNLLRTVAEVGFAQCTVAMCFYLFRALEKTGLYEYTDRYWNIWRTMVANHCTTCVEAENYARSECHAWGALALYELPAAVLGVRPAAPGYEKILVRPRAGHLTHASGCVCTPRGELKVQWEKTENGIETHVDGPGELLERIVSS